MRDAVGAGEEEVLLDDLVERLDDGLDGRVVPGGGVEGVDALHQVEAALLGDHVQERDVDVVGVLAPGGRGARCPWP